MRRPVARGAAALCCALLGCALLAACSGPLRRHPSASETVAPTEVLYVVRRGWHIDVGLERSSLQPTLRDMAAGLPSSRFVLFGFGDRRYLLARHKSVDGVMAILHPGPALLLVTGLDQTPESSFATAGVIELSVTHAQMASAQAAIAASRGAESAPLAAGPYAESLYFAAEQRYSAFHTCNTWAAEILQAAGFAVQSSGTLFATQLWWQVEGLSSHTPPAPVHQAP